MSPGEKTTKAGTNLYRFIPGLLRIPWNILNTRILQNLNNFYKLIKIALFRGMNDNKI